MKRPLEKEPNYKFKKQIRKIFPNLFLKKTFQPVFRGLDYLDELGIFRERSRTWRRLAQGRRDDQPGVLLFLLLLFVFLQFHINWFGIFSWTGLVIFWWSELFFGAFTFLAGFNSPHNWVFLLPQNLQKRNSFLTFCFVLWRRLLMTTFGIFDKKQNRHLTLLLTIVVLPFKDVFSHLKCCIKLDYISQSCN